MLSILLLIVALSTNAFQTLAFNLPPSHHASTTSLRMSRPREQQPISTPVPPPPPISMPVWSLTSPIPNSSTSSMSIVTFATSVSVSSPKLWAVSLYKTSRTRCAFLGVEKSGDEYNDIAVTSSSVMNSPGAMNAIRRRDVVGGEGMLAADEGAVGWRARQLSMKGVGTAESCGEGILQLLTPSQAKLVPILGKKTGWDNGYCKKTECGKKLGLDDGWVRVHGSSSQRSNNPNEKIFEVLPNCASYIQLKLKRVTDGGDHDVAICEVIGTGVWDDKRNTIRWLTENESGGQTALDSTSVLYTGQLREEGII